MEEEVSNNGGPWRARMNSRAPRQKEKKNNSVHPCIVATSSQLTLPPCSVTIEIFCLFLKLLSQPDEYAKSSDTPSASCKVFTFCLKILLSIKETPFCHAFENHVKSASSICMLHAGLSLEDIEGGCSIFIHFSEVFMMSVIVAWPILM